MNDLILNYLNLADLGPIETVEAAAKGGFHAVGLRISDHVPGGTPILVGNTAATAETASRARDLGVAVATVSTYRLIAERRVEDYRPVIETAARLGAPMIALNCFDPDEARATALVAEIAEIADEARIRLALEFIPVSAMKTLPAASRIVRATGRTNVGINLDALHFVRSGAQAPDIAAADPRHLYSFHLCDAPLAPPADLAAEMRAGRLYPGEGEFPLDAIADALPAGIEFEVEVPHRRVAHLPGAERARRAFIAATRFIEARRRRTASDRRQT